MGSPSGSGCSMTATSIRRTFHSSARLLYARIMSSWTEFLVRRGATFDGDAVTRFPAPEEELAAARDAAVVCDLAPLAAMRVAGQDAAAFLQGQLTSDVAALAVGTAQYSAWCSPKGRMLANFILLQTEATTFELLLPVSMMAAVRKRLTMFVLRSKLTIEDTSGVSFRIGCYTGQEIVARTQYLGRLKERTFLAHVEGPPPGPGEKLYSMTFGDQSCGTVLNAAPAPGGGSDLVATLQIAAAQSDDVRI